MEGTVHNRLTAVGAAEPLSIICFLFDPNIGGQTMFARDLFRHMAGAGHRARIAFCEAEGTAASFIAEAGLDVDKLPIDKPVLPSKPWAFLKFALRFPRNVWRVRRYLKDHAPDVILVNGVYDLGPALASRLAGVPVVWNLADTVFGQRLSRMLGWGPRLLATRIICASDQVVEHYGLDLPKSTVIHSPVDVTRFAVRPPRSLEAEPLLGLLANWNWIKGQDRFVEVIHRLRQAGRLVRGRIMGRFLDSQKNFWEPILTRIDADGLDPVIERLGFVADTVPALRELDILLLTSHSEGSPICVLEGMSIGIPLVVFEVSGVREMLGAGDAAAGIVVPQGDIAAMTDAIARILDDPVLYAQMAANGQARARTEFALEICAARHEAVYRQALN